MSLHLSKNKRECLSIGGFKSDMKYLMNCTRQDIAYTNSKHRKYIMSKSEADHQKAIIRVLTYLRYTRTNGLHYTKYPTVLEGYNDMNWISKIKDSQSTSGYVFTLGGAAMSQKILETDRDSQIHYEI